MNEDTGKNQLRSWDSFFITIAPSYIRRLQGLLSDAINTAIGDRFLDCPIFAVEAGTDIPMARLLSTR